MKKLYLIFCLIHVSAHAFSQDNPLVAVVPIQCLGETRDEYREVIEYIEEYSRFFCISEQDIQENLQPGDDYEIIINRRIEEMIRQFTYEAEYPVEFIITICNDHKKSRCSITQISGIAPPCERTFNGPLYERRYLDQLKDFVMDFITTGNCPPQQNTPACSDLEGKSAEWFDSETRVWAWWYCLSQEWQDGLKDSYLPPNSNVDVDFLNSLLQETDLEISPYSNISDLSGCKHMTNLKSITIYANTLENFDGIECLPNLEVISYPRSSTIGSRQETAILLQRADCKTITDKLEFYYN